MEKIDLGKKLGGPCSPGPPCVVGPVLGVRQNNPRFYTLLYA